MVELKQCYVVTTVFFYFFEEYILKSVSLSKLYNAKEEGLEDHGSFVAFHFTGFL